MSLDSGQIVEIVTGEDDEILKREFDFYKAGTIRFQPHGWFLTSHFQTFANKFYNFEFRPTDIVIIAMPKSGTTWTQEMLWTMVNNPNLDNPTAVQPIDIRVPILELDTVRENPSIKALMPIPESTPTYKIFRELCPEGKLENGMNLQILEAKSDPRTFKTHLPFPFFKDNLLDKCKVIYLTRNPKDVCISSCHHMKMEKGINFSGSLDDFVHHFVNDRLLYGPYWKHIKEAFDQRSHPNLHHIVYEKLINDIEGEVNRLNTFLGLNLNEKQKGNVIKHSSFSSMKSRNCARITSKYLNEDVVKKEGGFFRKGISGDWKTTLTSEQAKLFDDWTEKNTKAFHLDGDWIPTK